jgi:NTP pyrophosphatase (non-canonical NTP hydrolase)
MTDAQLQFIKAWHALAEETYAINVSKGFMTPGQPVSIGDQCMLIASEVAEGYEAWRKDLKDDKITHRDGLEVELADAVIRIINLAKHLGYDIPAALVEKSDFNANRPYMHGGKKT